MAEPDGVQHAVVDAVLADPVVQAVLATSEGTSTPPVAATVAHATQPGQAGEPGPAKPDVMFLPSGQPIAAPTTTEEEDRTSAGQRATSDMWEETQRRIALSVTWAALSVSMWLAIMSRIESIQTAALVFLFGVANLVIGFYFGRTNHTKVGGISQRER